MWRASTKQGSQALRKYHNFLKTVNSIQDWKVGSQIHGFKVVRKEIVPEYSIAAIQLQHEFTKADYLHIDSDDTNNVFR
jgi:hypothetical protein